MAKTKGKGAKPAKAAKKAPAKAAKKKAPAPKAARAKPAAPAATARAAPAPRPATPPPPAAPPPPPPPRDELPAPRDVGRLLRYGEKFGDKKIDVRMLPIHLPVTTGALAVFDPAQPKTWRVFDRPTGNGQFGVMVSIARDGAGKERLAAIVIHTGRPPIAKWTVAHYHGQKKPKSPEQVPRIAVTSGLVGLVDAGTGSPGPVAATATSPIQPLEIPLTDGRKALLAPSGNGDFAAYWAVDATDKPIALVLDFDAFTQKEWRVTRTTA